MTSGEVLIPCKDMVMCICMVSQGHVWGLRVNGRGFGIECVVMLGSFGLSLCAEVAKKCLVARCVVQGLLFRILSRP